MVDLVAVATRFFAIFVENFGVLSFTRQDTPLKVRMKGGNQLGHLCEAYMKRTTMSCIVG